MNIDSKQSSLLQFLITDQLTVQTQSVHSTMLSDQPAFLSKLSWLVVFTAKWSHTPTSITPTHNYSLYNIAKTVHLWDTTFKENTKMDSCSEKGHPCFISIVCYWSQAFQWSVSHLDYFGGLASLQLATICTSSSLSTLVPDPHLKMKTFLALSLANQFIFYTLMRLDAKANILNAHVHHVAKWGE